MESKLRNLVFSAGVASALLVSPSASNARPHDPRALDRVIERVEEAHDRGQRPVVVFDLDETTLDSLGRTFRILREFANQDDVRERFPWEARRTDLLRLRDVGYHVEETLAEAGIDDVIYTTEAKSYWKPRYYSDRYSAADRAIPGAAAYLHRVARTGALIVYLTGRDRPRMEQGTLRALRANRFPLGANVELVMKPDRDVDDLTFKQDAFAFIGRWGTVVAGFENEPANINAMFRAFPGADLVFLDTAHSRRPDRPDPSIAWVRNYR